MKASIRRFPKYFADAESSFDGADFVIFGAPYDKTHSFRSGARYAPQEIRKAAWNIEAFNMRTGLDIRNYKVHDMGDINIENDAPADAVRKIKEDVERIIHAGKFPILLGGEHSLTSGAVAGLGEKVFVISIDAHMDYRDEYENERHSHACVMRRISEVIGPKNMAIIGVRSGCAEEVEEARKDGILYIDAYRINEKGMDSFIPDLMAYISAGGAEKIYLTLDIDGIDPSFAPGTGTPEPFGINPYDVLKIIDAVPQRLVGFDVMEVCPPFDNGNTSMLAARLVREVITKVKG